MQLWENMPNPLAANFYDHGTSGGVSLEPKMSDSGALQQYTELILGLLLGATTVSLGMPVAPREVRVGHAPRAEESSYEESFGCPVRFNTGGSAVEFHDSTLSLPLNSPDKQLADLATEEVHRQVEKHYGEGSDFIGQVRTVLKYADFAKDWRLATLAEKFRMPPRTFQHKLQQFGTNLQVLTDSVRRIAALKYLEAGLAMDEISYKLGYADAGGFRKAFHRWYAVNPSDWKRGGGSGPVRRP